MKPTVKVEVPKWPDRGRPIVSGRWQATAAQAQWQGCVAAPGMRDRIELDEEQAVTMEIRVLAQSIAQPPTSLASEEEGIGARKSEAPIGSGEPW